MKFILMLALTATAALACPNLNGTFNKCTTGDRTIDDLSGISRAKLEITQAGNKIAATFMSTTMNIEVGSTVQNNYYDNEEMAKVESTITASCNGDVLQVQEDMKMTYNWGQVVNSTTDSDIYLQNSNKKVIMDMTTTEGSRRTNMTITCQRM